MDATNCFIRATAYEVPFAVQVPAAWRDDALACLPHGAVVDPPGGAPSEPARGSLRETKAEDGRDIFRVEATADGFRTFAGVERTGSRLDRAGALEQLRRDLMIHVADCAPSYVFVHAGVVAVNGHGVMLPGTSFAGKTTLVAGLVKAGATYYSDEYAVIDAAGWVYPYSRELQVRAVGETAQQAVPVGALGGTAGFTPVRVTHVLFARYVLGGVWAPQPVSAGMAVLEMLRHSIPVQRTPARVMATLGKVMAGAGAWESERGDAGGMVGEVMSWVGAGLG